MVYVRSSNRPPSPTFSDLSSTVSLRTQKQVENLSKNSETFFSKQAKKLSDNAWDEIERREKERVEKLSWPVTESLDYTTELENIQDFSSHDLFSVKIENNKIICNDISYENDNDFYEKILLTVVHDTLLVIFVQNEIGEVKIILFSANAFRVKFLQPDDDPYFSDSLIFSKKQTIPTEDDTFFAITKLEFQESTGHLLAVTEHKGIPKIIVYKLDLNSWKQKIQESIEESQEKSSETEISLLDSDNFLPPEIIFERLPEADAKFENLSQKMASRYAKLHIYLSRCYETKFELPEKTVREKVVAWFLNEKQIGLCWMHEWPNKVFFVDFVQKVAKKGQAEQKTNSIVLVDDIKSISINDENKSQIACLCGLERSLIFVYQNSDLLTVVKGKNTITSTIFSKDSLLVSYRDNSIVSYKLPNIPDKSNPLAVTMSVLQNPIEKIIKKVFPQDEEDDKQFEIIPLSGTPYYLYDSSNQALLIGHDQIQKLKTSNEFDKQSIRRVQVILSTENVCEFHVLFANENLYTYRLLL